MNTLQPQRYLDKIGTLNNIHLTLREIDVIACVLSGKLSKTISSLLNIKTSTYERHYANLKKKLAINTKEKLINLIENDTSTVMYKQHAWLLQVERNMFECAKSYSLGQKMFLLSVSQNSNPLFVDLLKRHMKIFNIILHIKQEIPENENSALNLIFTPLQDDNHNKNALHVHLQNDMLHCSDRDIYFRQSIEYFDFFITILEKLNPEMNAFYIKQKIRNLLSKQEEGFYKIHEPVSEVDAENLEQDMSEIPTARKIWLLSSAVVLVSGLTLLIPSISTQKIIYHNLQSIGIGEKDSNSLQSSFKVDPCSSELLAENVDDANY
jgi:DNA-binding CsgD family transcriptional regulator